MCDRVETCERPEYFGVVNNNKQHKGTQPQHTHDTHLRVACGPNMALDNASVERALDLLAPTAPSPSDALPLTSTC